MITTMMGSSARTTWRRPSILSVREFSCCCRIKKSIADRSANGYTIMLTTATRMFNYIVHSCGLRATIVMKRMHVLYLNRQSNSCSQCSYAQTPTHSCVYTQVLIHFLYTFAFIYATSPFSFYAKITEPTAMYIRMRKR